MISWQIGARVGISAVVGPDSNVALRGLHRRAIPRETGGRIDTAEVILRITDHSQVVPPASLNHDAAVRI